MKKTVLSAAIATALLLPAVSAFAEDAPAPSPLTFNVGIVSDYIFRGISQTHGDAAISAGVDYAFSNGAYIGAWTSTISWVKDFLGSGSTEVDLYGGYRNTFAGGDWNYDLGLIAYTYPSHGNAVATNLANPTTREAYAAIGYKWLTLKYSHAFSQNFVGWYGGANLDKNTKNSNYVELNAAYDLGDGWGVSGHVGHQKIENSVTTTAGVKSASYSDWKIGVTKDVGFGVVGLAYSDTDTSGSCNSSSGGTNPYCWGTNFTSAAGFPTRDFKDVSKGKAVLSFSKTF